ncbi:toll/interleukin-1 receptor domain-containing protein [Dictyobacter aurantiacus]|uniref:toll/interleukin-1 receptor domain-containing protein n=1 Tax=Dictyobacter aurantiacus TaxID=1936993 RepID=UPI00135AACCD|nr:toll/interleukin-1 receptor domain-containing protein [Dictyobacter aurantiacus]
MSDSSIEIFISYAHEDEKLLKKIEKQLKILKHHGDVITWHDRKINAGLEWKQEIDFHLKSANIILLLISTDFMASDYCYSVELEQALARHHNGDCRVIPVILRPTIWKNEKFSKLQALPANGKPVTNWSNKDKAFVDIAEGIQKVISELKTLTREVGDIIPKITDTLPIPNMQKSLYIQTEDSQNDVISNEKNIEDDQTPIDDIEDDQTPIDDIEDDQIPIDDIEDDQDNMSDMEGGKEESFYNNHSLGFEDQENSLFDSALSVEDVRMHWETFRKHIRTTKDGIKISALLKGAIIQKVINAGDSQEKTTIIIRAYADFHYKSLQFIDKSIIEWAFEITLNRPCSVVILPPLTLQKIKDSWEIIRQRVRSRSDGVKIAAILAGFDIISLVSKGDVNVITLKAHTEFHYKTLNYEGYLKSVIWVMESILDGKCQLRILPPR